MYILDCVLGGGYISSSHSTFLNLILVSPNGTGGVVHISSSHSTFFKSYRVSEWYIYQDQQCSWVWCGCGYGGGGYFVHISSSLSTFFNLIIVSPNGTSTRINNVHECGVGMTFYISSQTAKFMGPTCDEHCYQGLQCGSAQPTGWTLAKIVRNQNVYLCHSEFSVSLL